MDAELLAIVERAIAGDQAAFEELIHRYSGLLYAQIYGMIKHPGEAEDLVQDTFIKAYTYRQLLADPNKFPAWIMAIARNLARDWLRRSRPVRAGDELLSQYPDPAGRRPEWRLEQSDLRSGVLAALKLLPERQRLAITLRYFENMDYRSIEQAMGVSNGALRGMLERARIGLRSLLRPMVDDERNPPAGKS